MHRAEIDQEHNRLILRWIDSHNITEVDQLQAEIELLLPNLRPGFDCISDIANMRPSSQHVGEHIERLQAFLHKAGMRRVVRIVGKSGGAHLASTQMDRSAARVGYDTIHVNTEAEALLALSQVAAPTRQVEPHTSRHGGCQGNARARSRYSSSGHDDSR